MDHTLDRHALIRKVNQRRVLDVILKHGPTSRVKISELAGLSKPAVNKLVQDLVASGLVRQEGRTSGSVGRSAALYSIENRATMVVGIDLGGTKIRVATADLLGEILAEQVEPTTGGGGQAVLRQLSDLSRGLVRRSGFEWKQVAAVGLATPGVFDPSSDHVDLAYNIPGFGDLNLTDELKQALGMDVILDNDVNLAAVGERWKGLAAQASNYVFIAIGTGFGMGLVVDGRLVHGSRGAAGEIAYLPIGSDLVSDASWRQRGALEEAAAGSGIEAEFRSRIDKGGKSRIGRAASAADIFAAAATGDSLSNDIVRHEARLVALAILAVSSVVDPELVVLGGSIGSNPQLIDPVRKSLAEIAPFDIRVETSVLGDRASVIGAVAAGVEQIQQTLYG